MPEPTPLSERALAIQRQIDELTQQLAEQDEHDTESRTALIEQIEILKAEKADRLP